ncbi:MAG: DUF971 domain-containing protein [Acidobacteriota bacterium]
MSTAIPLEIKKTAPNEVMVCWKDHTSKFSTKYLRCECACAGCVSEITGKRILDPNTVSEDITITKAMNVGSYGVQFFFSDGHSNGIYTWTHLRQICPCSQCRTPK